MPTPVRPGPIVMERQPAREVPVVSLGQQMLLQLDAPLGEIAARLGGITRMAVSAWRTGKNRPNDAKRRALERHFGIPASAWGSHPVADPTQIPAPLQLTDAPPPVSTPSGPIFLAPAAAPDPEPAPPPAALDDEDPDAAPPSVLDDFDQLLGVLRRQLRLPHLTPRERAQLTDAMTRAVTQRAKVEQQKQMLEDATIRTHPKWRQLKALLIEALLPYPDAARAVEAAVTRALGEETDDG